MTYDTAERSNYGGKPVALFSFSLGPNEWNYVEGEEGVTVGGRTYLAATINDNGSIQSGDVTNDDYTVYAESSLAILNLFLGTPPSVEIYLTVRHWNIGEPDAPIVGVYLVRNAKRVSELQWEIVCRALTASLNRNGLRLGWTRNCPHALYDHNCRVNPLAYRVPIVVEGLTGVSIISTGISGLPSGYLSGGYFEWEWYPGVTEKRAIEVSSGSVINVLGTTDGMQVGQTIYAYPGCNRTISMCASRFGNTLNYGGFPHMPGKSPFDGDPVF
jgi:uncharacterized phage protein (TIGR02218 family)